MDEKNSASDNWPFLRSLCQPSHGTRSCSRSGFRHNRCCAPIFSRRPAASRVRTGTARKLAKTRSYSCAVYATHPCVPLFGKGSSRSDSPQPVRWYSYVGGAVHSGRLSNRPPRQTKWIPVLLLDGPKSQQVLSSPI